MANFIVTTRTRSYSIQAKNPAHALAIFERRGRNYQDGECPVSVMPAPNKRGKHRKQTDRRRANFVDPFEVRREL